VTLFLLRHGQTDWNIEPARCQGWQDVGLNATGRAQARARGRALRGRGIERIVTSHLRRARETAELVREALLGSGSDPPDPLPLIVDPRLAETYRGRWEGRLFVDIIREEPAAWRAYREHPETFRCPGGESLGVQQRRVLAALRDAALDGRTVLAVTHGGAMRLVRRFLDGDDGEDFRQPPADNGSLLEIPARGFTERMNAAILGKP
jgi:probable phosphoglycerate mutase